MPAYIFEHPDTGETREEFQKMDEPHVYIDENGIECKRVFTVANFSVDGKINPFSSKGFVDATRNKKMSVGDLWDMSAEMSQQREGRVGGKDPVLNEYEKKEQNKRKGKPLSPANVRKDQNK